MDEACQCEEGGTVANASGGSPMHWYTLQVTAGYEARVRESIGKGVVRLGMASLVGQILFPIEKISEIRNGRKCTRIKKLYPGYLFVELDLYDESGELRHGLWQFIRSTTGVLGFLGGEKPLTMKQKDIDLIVHQTEVGEKSEKFKNNYSVGMLVKVTDGPFAGSEGEISTMDEQAGNVCVLVGLFGRLTPVDLEFWQIVKKEV
ncbi:MAG: transcription termination/antitermination protein NusG [Puniceicoccales bacterium]|jgi:transcriptional antiterminator NusG|nr:transcription termination/antitermination protein NusG [Puniceicoccales bacterium]